MSNIPSIIKIEYHVIIEEQNGKMCVLLLRHMRGQSQTINTTQAHIHTHTHNWLKKGGAMGRPTQNNPLKAQGGGFSST